MFVRGENEIDAGDNAITQLIIIIVFAVVSANGQNGGVGGEVEEVGGGGRARTRVIISAAHEWNIFCEAARRAEQSLGIVEWSWRDSVGGADGGIGGRGGGVPGSLATSFRGRGVRGGTSSS